MDRISLLRITVFIVCVCVGFCDIKWINTMDQFTVAEVPGTEENKEDWKKYIYTLNAVNDVNNSSVGIIYGFKDDSSSNPYAIIDTHDHFRIVNTTGEVYFHGTRLDYEEPNDRDIKFDLLAKFRDNSKWTKQSSTVLVSDVNDNTPYFANDSLTFSILENTKVEGDGIRVLSYINIKDVDYTLSKGQKFLQVKIDYCIIKSITQPCDDMFRLQPRRNSPRDYLTDFYVMKELDYEAAETFQVQLQITDGLNVDTSDITVTVIDVQDEPPIWKTIATITDTFDGTQPFEMNIRMIAEDQDTAKRPIHYELLTGDNNGISIHAIFEIGNLTGIISNKIELDLENTTYFYNRANPKIRRNVWYLVVKACEILVELADPKVGETALECIETGITVSIKDVNDNRPKHDDTELYIYDLDEDAENGHLLHDPPIMIFDTDMDYFQFRTEFLEESDVFRIGGTDKTPEIIVKDSSLIDYDMGIRQYNLTLITYDIDNNLLSSTAKVEIRIRDINDNSPKFPRKVYNNTFIREDAQEGEPVIKIQATDIDSGIFGTIGIRYERSGGYAHLFNIDKLSGQLTVARCETYGVTTCLDYDVLPTKYTLFITAKDTRAESNSRRATVILEVQLLDVNDNVPEIPNYDVSILEGRVHFDPEFRVVATDKDTNSVLSYSILTQSPGNFWAINERTGEIFVNKPSGEGIKYTDGDDVGDGERRFNLDIRVSDSKYVAQSHVNITVIDQNDNAPVFFPNRYEISINETIPSGSFVLQLFATDLDDPTSKLKYYLQSGNQGGKFTFDGDTGILTVTVGEEFDYDITRRYEMIAIVNDGGRPQLSDNTTIIVHILDENNKDPSIKPFMQWMTCYDNALPGYIVGQVSGYDPDFDAVLVFEWFGTKEASSEEGYEVDPDSGYDFRELFAVSADGQVTVNKLLDSKNANLVSYGVIVYDVTPTPWQSGTGTILINILPYNKDKPAIEPFQSPIYIDEEQPRGYVIMSIIARDNNGIELFSISEHPDDFVTIDPRTGSVSINNRINYDDDRMYNGTYFKVLVIDRGVPQFSTEVTVSVIFMNINDNFPEFMDPVTRDPVSIYTYRIQENSPNGTLINKVFAFDEDRPDNNTFNEVRYFMDDDRFDVDHITGQMFVRLQNGAVLDREINSHIYARVIARDNPNGPAENRNQRAASVQITLTDANDNPPRFTSDEYVVRIFERIATETVILQLFYNDADIGTNKIAFFTKIKNQGTDIENFFDVEKELGRVYVDKSVLHHVGRYKFFVLATDNLGTGLTANTTVVVIVQPSANKVPIWVNPPITNMSVPVLEEQYKGMLVYDADARDDDEGLNGIVQYSFIHNGETLQETPEFRINIVTGIIHAKIAFDRENVDKYVLLLKAKDRGDTPLETTRFLTILIIDVNDNAPIFEDREVQIDVSENQQLGDIKTIPSATDLDLDDVIVYDIISGNEGGVFELDRNSRMLRLLTRLDQESTGIYYMDVRASNDEDDYTVIRSRRRRATDPSIITIKVVVGNINDLAPAFLQDEYYGCVSSRSPYDKHILQIQAIDRDAIGKGVVRYTVAGGNKVANLTLFDIHERNGIITNKVLMRRYADSTFFVTVNARDREDSATAESADIVAKIFVNQPANEVKLLLTQNTGEVRLYQSQVQSIIEEALDLDYVCINEIREHSVNTMGSVTTLWSEMYVSGIRREVIDGNERYSILPSMELTNIINRERNERKSDFDLLYIRDVEVANSSNEMELDDSAILIITIIMAVLIFLVIIFCIMAFVCIRQVKRQKKAKLLHKTHATPPPMINVVEAKPVVVEPVVYDNRAYVREQEPVVIEESHVVEYDPVHVQYAVVQKRSPSPQIEHMEYVVQDDQDAIVVELLDDGQQPSVYEAEPEFTIETDLVPEKM